jgi:hypothetical protein
VIDLKKAFDKVNLFGVLCMLQERGVDSMIIKILENWFSKNVTTIKWNGMRSDQAPLMAGVKQGVFFPYIILLYLRIKFYLNWSCQV